MNQPTIEKEKKHTRRIEEQKNNNKNKQQRGSNLFVCQSIVVYIPVVGHQPLARVYRLEISIEQNLVSRRDFTEIYLRLVHRRVDRVYQHHCVRRHDVDVRDLEREQ